MEDSLTGAPLHQVEYLPTFFSPVHLEISELLKGKPLVYLGSGFTDSRQRDAAKESDIVRTQIEKVGRQRPQTSRARLQVHS